MPRTAQFVSSLSVTSISTAFDNSLVCEICRTVVDLSQLPDDTTPTISVPSSVAGLLLGKISTLLALQDVAGNRMNNYQTKSIKFSNLW